jgi:hypothetical protein
MFGNLVFDRQQLDRRIQNGIKVVRMLSFKIFIWSAIISLINTWFVWNIVRQCCGVEIEQKAGLHVFIPFIVDIQGFNITSSLSRVVVCASDDFNTVPRDRL